jgi:alkanesulfonate monooxygenase SsuD/methylene tetrahydromethanopterin reductase-like flavin-dependent oxidoreductase (luciferase family)
LESRLRTGVRVPTTPCARCARPSVPPTPVYDGPYCQFGEVAVEPHAVQKQMPLWVGGRTRRSLRRAVELGDGWAPFALAPGQIRDWLTQAAKTDAWHQRATPIEVTLVPEPPVDPLGAPEATAAVARELHEAGATAMALRFIHTSVAHYLDQVNIHPG